MRLPLQLIALASGLAVLAVVWIAFAHCIRVPGTDAETSSLLGPLVALAVCALGLAWTSRAALRGALDRAARGAASRSDERAAQLAVFGLVVVGFLLRIARTDEYGLNPDEAQLVWLAAAPTLPEVWSYETAISPHPPAVFAVLHAITMLSWDLVWLRLPAVLGGSFAIWMSYRLGRELVGMPAGLAMAWLVSFSPPLFELSRVARNYAPGFAFIVLALFLLVRFFETRRWRYFAWYTLAATIAVCWHYVFVVVFIAMKFLVALQFLRQREPLGSWIKVGVMQLPFAAVMLFLYVVHVAQLPPYLADMHAHWYQGMLGIDPSAPLRPLYALWTLLAPGGTRVALMGLSGLGVVVLAARRQWLALGFCTLPLGLAIGFAWTGAIPLGASRHSAYLFPFLFLLAACNAPELLTGYRATRSALSELSPRLHWLAPGDATWAAGAWGAAAAGLLAALFAGSSLLDYNDDPGWRRVRSALIDPLTGWAGRRSYHGVELVRSYRQRDVERAFELVERYAGPNDWVVLDFAAAYALRLYLELPPQVFRDDLETKQRDVSMVVFDGLPLRYLRNGVQYYHSSLVAQPTQLNEVMLQVRDIRRFYDVGRPRKIWLIRGAWSPPLTDRFAIDERGVRIDRRAYHESHGLVLGIEMSELRRVSRGEAAEQRKYIGKQRMRRVPSEGERRD